MIYSPLIKNAMTIAILAHCTQFDRGGYPYIHHPLHLAEQMDDEYSCAAAILHDVLEDSTCTVEDFRASHIPEPVIEAVELLTRPSDLSYMKYIDRLKNNEIARKVKIADLKHNLDITRLKHPPTKHSELRLAMYRKALRTLEVYVSGQSTDRQKPDENSDNGDNDKITPVAADAFYGMAVPNEVLESIAKNTGRSVVDVRNEWSDARGDFVKLPNGVEVLPIHLSSQWCEDIIFAPLDFLNGDGVEKECEFFLESMKQPSPFFAAYSGVNEVVSEFRNAIGAYVDDPRAKEDWWWKSHIGSVQCAVHPRD